MKLEPGTRVHIVFDATVVSGNSPTLGYHVQSDNGLHSYIGDEAHVVSLDPPFWPPQAGDVWSGDGLFWFVREHRQTTTTPNSYYSAAPHLVMVPVRGHELEALPTPRSWREQHSKVRLVYRQGECGMK